METKLDEVVPFDKQTDDLKRRLAKNNEAKMVIYNALPRKEYERIFMCTTAKEIWKTLLITHQGNSQVKDNKIDLLVQQYEQFVISEDESARFNTIITSLNALDEGYSSKNYVRKFLRALHPKWRAKVTAIDESKDLTSLSLDELIENLKVYEMIIKKNSKIVKAKFERKFLALKAKKESSYEECSTSRSEDEEYAMAVRDNLRMTKRQCPKPPKDKNQRAFVGGSWSDSGEEDDDKINDETCLVAQAPIEVCSESSYFSDKNSSIDDLVLDNEYDKLCKMSLKIITKNKRLNATKNSIENELRELNDKFSTLEKNKGVDLECPKCELLKIENEKLKEEAFKLTKFEKSTHCLNEMLYNQKPSGDKLGLGFNSFEASSGGTKKIKFVKAHKKASSDGGQICDNKCRVTFSEHDSKITKDGKVIGRGIRKKGLYVMKLGNKPKDKICLATIDENSTLWHRRLGHANMYLIQSLPSKELVRNLPKLKFDQHFCDACKIRKQAHASHKAKNIVSMTRCLELLHMELFGPSAVRSYRGNRYTLVIVDDYSRTDHGREFDNEMQFGEFCNANGITHNFSAPRTPQSNGVVERKNRTLHEISRNMLNEQSLPQKFWCNAIDTSTYILNRILIRAILGKTPYEILRDEEKAIKVTEKKDLENDIEDGTLEIDEIVNIKEPSVRKQPKNVNDALGDESWIVAMQEELNQFIANNIWELVPQPRNMTIIRTKWVFRNKLDENGVVSRNKASLVGQGYNQQEGINYDETYALVARLKSIRILLAYACALDFKLFQMDVKSAFLNGFINEEVYVAQPPGYIDFKKPDRVYKLKKALHCLKQAPNAWYDRLKSFLIKHEYKIGMVDNTPFTKKKSSNLIIIQIYVNDIIFGLTCQDMCDEFSKIMHDEFEMSMMGELNFFLGLQIKQMEDGIFFNQSKYIKHIIMKFGLEESKPMKTPMSSDTKLTKDEELSTSVPASKRLPKPLTLKRLSISSDTLKALRT
ncbi:retrovirus-related pol polyprotein from transposon TNT 1-94 [Tanacetum coccineum]|uniref:Retrovirus-related pol polyprotein from transposon TNT 1-94 n=1 Tax=Tanacetum coccineum TaxID=301880 RepID=A0ABQ5DPV8_9ASTR